MPYNALLFSSRISPEYSGRWGCAEIMPMAGVDFLKNKFHWFYHIGIKIKKRLDIRLI
jgi:hypothetical protein